MKSFILNFILVVLLLSSLAVQAAAEQASSPFSTTIRENVISNLLPNIATKENTNPNSKTNPDVFINANTLQNYRGKEVSKKTVIGAVIASSYSESNPSPCNNYMYTWARDTAITMNEIYYLLEEAVTSKNQADINKFGQYYGKLCKLAGFYR